METLNFLVKLLFSDLLANMLVSESSPREQDVEKE